MIICFSFPQPFLLDVNYLVTPANQLTNPPAFAVFSLKARAEGISETRMYRTSALVAAIGQIDLKTFISP